ncbi:hypothetical protein [Sphingomonas sp.]|uniref:hypothetical protein n=1 Tax=Sphingomonas sp. TaxID=28214 RepID=UPI003D6D5DF3
MRKFLPIIFIILAGPVSAQTVQVSIPPPIPYQTEDENGIDPVTLRMASPGPSLAIGSGAGEMKMAFSGEFPMYGNNLLGRLNFDLLDVSFTVSFDGKSEDLYPTTGQINLNEDSMVGARGGTLTFSDATKSAVYISGDGTRIDFKYSLVYGPIFGGTGYGLYLGGPVSGVATKIAYPSGNVIDINYTLGFASSYPSNCNIGSECSTLYDAYRIKSLQTSFGYQAKFEYHNSTDMWLLKKAYWINEATKYCSLAVDSCGYGTILPSIKNEPRTSNDIQDALGGTYSFSYNVAGDNDWVMLSARTPVSSSALLSRDSVWNETSSAPFHVTKNGQTWTYQRLETDNLYPTYDFVKNKITDPLGNVTTIEGSYRRHLITKVTDSLGHAISYEYDNYKRITKVTLPEGNYVSYTYDGRGNVTQKTVLPKPGSGLAALTESAIYPATCGNVFTCNKPTSMTNPKGNVTSYSYDVVHGGLLMETFPAVSGVSPVKRYSYTQRYAWIKDSTGAYVRAAHPIWLLADVKTCKTSATAGSSCAGGALDEVVTSYDYGADSGPNNLLLRGTTVSNGGVSLRACYGYDEMGRKISETAPRAGLASCP